MSDDQHHMHFPSLDTLEYGGEYGCAEGEVSAAYGQFGRLADTACASPAPPRTFSSIAELINDVRMGKPIILVDSHDRENEGDIVIPAQFATDRAINFMARNARGLICLAITPARAEALQLRPMVAHNGSPHGTAFTVSIEAASGVTTGISAHDRARTIAVAIDPTTGPADLVSPGHIFPLIARAKGVLDRPGHTEAAVDIARLAGLIPAGVICEIMNDDGSMARLPDLRRFAGTHGLRIGSIEDLIAYRRATESDAADWSASA